MQHLRGQKVLEIYVPDTETLGKLTIVVKRQSDIKKPEAMGTTWKKNAAQQLSGSQS